MPSDAIDAWIERTADARLDELFAFIRIPTVGVLSEHVEDVRAGAAWLAERYREIGLEHVEVSETGGRPVVYADWLHADGAPTVIVYGHYDVQPVDPVELWDRPPFEPRLEDGRIYGRGAADDKGQVHLHLWAVRAWLEVEGRLPVNVRFVIEGEEEGGSANFESWLSANRSRLDADLVVVSDTNFYDANRPALTVGLRGNMHLQVDVTGPRQDLHSGTHGGMIQNPASALVRILSTLTDADGRVTVPGFYDECTDIDPGVRDRIARLSFDERAYLDETGAPGLFGEPGYTPLERRGARPTLDVCGMWSGFQGEGSKTIIPAHAHAKVSCRLVPGMEARRTYERVRDAILAVDVPGVRVEVSLQDAMDAFHTDPELPAAQAAAGLLEEVFGEAPLHIYEGGSIGAVCSFDRILGAPVVLLGFANPDDQAHAPNESLVQANYEGGLRTMVRYWETLAEGSASSRAASAHEAG